MLKPAEAEAHPIPLPSHVDVGDTPVTVLRWPAEHVLREALAAVGRPRILVVPVGVAPPAQLDVCEDWLRSPADPTELVLRAGNLCRRTDRRPPAPVVLDEDGVLRRGDRWVAISEAQAPVLRLLLDHVDRVVRFDDIVERYAAEGGSRHPASVRTVVSRLAERIRPLGLTLTTIRRRGFVLHTDGGPGWPLH